MKGLIENIWLSYPREIVTKKLFSVSELGHLTYIDRSGHLAVFCRKPALKISQD